MVKVKLIQSIKKIEEKLLKSTYPGKGNCSLTKKKRKKEKEIVNKQLETVLIIDIDLVATHDY